MEVIFALNVGATFCSFVASVVMTKHVEDTFVLNVEGWFFGECKEKVFISASANTSSPIFSLSCYA